MGKLESEFQSKLINDLYDRFPGCIVFKTDPSYIQGFPDLMILYQDSWAALECKRDRTADRQPNQEYYVDFLNQMSYAHFIYPENKEEVLNELQHAFKGSGRKTRVSRR